MSNSYITAPPTNGKVVLHTTAGPLEIELWPKETPKACRNFIQLCLEGYYDGTIFHRMVKEFIVQGGDPTGTGHGGESIYGEPFVDEFHSRLRFSHRGLLGMANTGANENASQFFFTLDRADELNKKNTLFGKIVGDTIYNLIKFGDLDTDEDERPKYPPKIIRTEVLSNPFDDIEPRVTPEERAAQAAAEQKSREAEEAAKKPKGKKNLKLLSFGEEAEDDPSAASFSKKSKSSHDLLKDDPRLSRQLAVDPADAREDASTTALQKLKSKTRRTQDDDSDDGDKEDTDFDRRMREKVKKRRTEEINGGAAATVSTREAGGRGVSSSDAKLSGIQAQIAQVQNEIRSIGTDKKPEPVQKKPKKEKLLEAVREEYAASGKAVSAKRKKAKGGETDTMDLLKRFQSKLRSHDSAVATPSTITTTTTTISSSNAHPESNANATTTKPEQKEPVECDLHFVVNCESCRDTFGDSTTLHDDDKEDEKGWMGGTLVFEKRKAANVYEPKVDDYTVEDPRKGGKSADFA
ncbi:Peptidyl-prolyl isomerase cwc27, partial [Thoreauomyces humboldtii]